MFDAIEQRNQRGSRLHSRRARFPARIVYRAGRTPFSSDGIISSYGVPARVQVGAETFSRPVRGCRADGGRRGQEVKMVKHVKRYPFSTAWVMLLLILGAIMQWGFK